ncbi:putative vma21-like domain-containing protein [Diplodia seriata]|uniref:Vacuolar ATPase assembly integral membrane protein vma21 n=2 Tax=Diplodia TaxID=66735 RepID=A0ABR3TKL1_9PEZI|nr:putative vma21-like domain-containing protein [Diplodia seriata]
MTSRRIVSTEKTLLDQDDAAAAPGMGAPLGDSNIAPAVPAHVIFKLLGFTFAMITLPIGTYFMTVNTIFKGNSTFAGGLAAVMANVVLIGYVIVAMKEDQSDRLEAEKEAKKAR